MPVGHTGRIRCFLQRFGAGRACGKDRKILMADIVFLLLFQGLRIRVSQVREHLVEQAEISLAGRAAAAI